MSYNSGPGRGCRRQNRLLCGVDPLVSLRVLEFSVFSAVASAGAIRWGVKHHAM
jgi:hypothetical protein